MFPLIAHVADMDEAIELQQNLIESIRENFSIISIKEPTLLLSNQLQRRKDIINSTQTIQGSETIKVILQKIELIDGTFKYTHLNEDIKRFTINTVKTGGVPFENIKDKFVFKIDKSILEDED